MFGAEEDGLFVGAFDLDAGGFDARAFFQGAVNNAAVKRAHRLQFHHVAPAAHLFGGGHGLLHQRVARFGPVVADIHHDLGHGLVLMEEQAVGQVLQVGKGLALPANQAAGIVGFDIEKDAVVKEDAPPRWLRIREV
jgi:hypothetical protein